MTIFGLIGYPLSHSFSPKYFEDKFKRDPQFGADAEYKLFPLRSISEFPELLKNHSSIVGLNVTIPFKESVIPFLNELDKTARDIGAVNCIKIETLSASKIKKLTGYNTDVWGFEYSLKKHIKPHHNMALILGTGGASKAVQYVLKKLNLEFLLVSRNKNYGSSQNSEPCIRYPEITKEIIIRNTLIINTTPLGMYPNVNTLPPVPYQFISEKHLLFDLVYNPSETLFMKKGKEKGATVVNGFEMLQLQAEKSWEIWNL